jgi:hypothetical protein
MPRLRTVALVSLALVLAAGCGEAGDGAAGETTSPTASPTSGSPSPTVVPAEQSPIDGEYTMTLTRQEVLNAGFRGGTASQIAGVWRVNFSLEWAQQFVNLGGGSMIFDGYQGGFAVDGDQLTLTDEPTLAFTWKRVGKRLTLSLIDESATDPVDALIWTIHPWELTGD